MLTQCPECKTVFRVRPEQLKAAGGKVRCSRCHTVFHAAEQRFTPKQESSDPVEPDKGRQPTQTIPREHYSRPAIRKARRSPEAPTHKVAKPTPQQKTPIPASHTPTTDDKRDQEDKSAPFDGVAGTSATKTEPQVANSAPVPGSGGNTGQPEGAATGDHTPSLRQDEPQKMSLRKGEGTTEAATVSADDIAEEATPEAPSKNETNRHTESSSAGAETNETKGHAEEPGASRELPPQTQPDTSKIQTATNKETDSADREEETQPGRVPEMLRSAEEEAASQEEEVEALPSLSTSDAEALLETMRQNLSANQTARENRNHDSEPSQEPLPGETDTREQASEREGKGETSNDEFESSLFDLFAPQEDDSHLNQGDKASSPASDDEVDSNWDLFSEQNIETLSNHYERNVKAEPAEEHPVTQPDTEQEEAETQTQVPAAEEPSPPIPAETEAEEPPEPSAEDWQEKSEAMAPPPPPDERSDEAEIQDEDTPTPSEEPPPATREAYSLPLQTSQRSGQGLRIALWGSGILLLCATLGLQYLYFFRDNLAENTTVRPLLSQMCQLTGCQLPPRRDVGKITLVDHLVQSHPRYRNSLLITATLMNRANFTQPFPTLEVVMTDLQQKVIARRRFTPEQYLIGGDKDRPFTPNTEIPLMLEVVDPGDAAVGFEFNFY